MTTYMLFTGDFFYARGGARDITKISEDLEELKTLVDTQTCNPEIAKFDWEWWHIYNVDTQEIILQSEEQAYET